MSISSFCLEQREREKAALKSLLAYSVAGSAALHLGLAIGIALIWPKQPSLADDTIELIMIDSPPEPEVIKTLEKAPEPLPIPKPQPVVTPPPEKPVATIAPEPIPIPKLDTPPPPQVVEPPKPLVPEDLSRPIEEPLVKITPEPIPIPNLNTPAPKVVEVPKPVEPVKETKPAPTPEPLPSPKVEELPKPVEPVKETKPAPTPEPLPSPKVSQPEETNNSAIAEKPLQSPSANSSPLQDLLTESKPTETANEEPPKIPGGLTANEQPRSNNANNTSQPLQPSAPENRAFRDNFTTANNTPLSTNPTDDASLNTPETPGEVPKNPETPPSRPITTSQPLQTSSSNRNREFRDSFSNSNSSLPDSSLSDTSSSSMPEAPGGVIANSQPPSNRPIAGGRPLPGSTSANRRFTENFSNSNTGSFGSNSNSNTGSFGSNPDSDFTPGTPGMSEGVATNQGVPPKPRTSGQGTQETGRQRRVARRGSAGGVRCIRQCQPQYPANLQNVEGRPEVRFILESDGSTTDPELAQTSGSSELDQAAIEAVRKMRFAPPAGGPVSVRIGINFASGGSNFERQARERREENERQRRERELQQQQQETESRDTENSTRN